MANTTTLDTDLLQLRIITKKQLKVLVPYCDQHILRLEKQGKFPKRVCLGENRVGWFQTDVVNWIKSRPVREYPATDDDMT